MRVADDLLDADVAGSSSGDRIEVSAWRGGRVLAPFLEVRSFQIDWDATRQVQGQASFVFSDPLNMLSPRAVDDALAPFGSQLQVTWVSGNNSDRRVPLGWWRIGSVDPAESWLIRKDAAGNDVFVPSGGSTLSVKADELMKSAELSRLDAEPVPANATCIGEIRRLLQFICPVTVESVADKSAPTDLVYEQSRTDAIDDHLGRLRAVARMSGGGGLEIIPDTGLSPVWEVAGGEHGVLIGVASAMDSSGIYNAVVSTSTNADNIQIVGRAYKTDGPLAWGGPFGAVPLFHQSIATTQSGVDSDAATILADRVHTASVGLDVECLMHPGLQMNDRVTLAIPGALDDIVGRVTQMSMSGADNLVSKRTKLRLIVDSEAYTALRRAS